LPISIAAALSACGGGSNVRENPPPAVTPQPAVDAHLTITGADEAQKKGYTGEGVRIGVVDTGVNRNHPALQGRVVANLNWIDPGSNDLSVDDVNGHGTTVAQIAAGQAVGDWPGGIAPNAEIVSVRFLGDTGSDGGLGLPPDQELAGINQQLIDQNVKIMNNSWSGLLMMWLDVSATETLAHSYRPFIEDHGGLVVFAAGNQNEADPSFIASLPSRQGPGNSKPAADLEKGWLVVVATETENPTQLASYSNNCGVAKNYCLAAPGTVTYTDPASGNELLYGTGTSFAAPMASGAAALVWEAYPYFSNDLVRQTLLGTATDIGFPGVDTVYGYGLLNAEKAVQGPAKFDWGDVTVEFDDIRSEWFNDISGAGGLTKRGTGLLAIRSTDNTYTGDTRVEGGTLFVGGLRGSNVSIGDAGTFVAGGAITGNVTNAGTFQIGESRVTLTGDYQQSSSGNLAMVVGDQLNVTGTARIAGGVHVLGKRDYVGLGSEYRVLQAGELVGRFDRVTAANNVYLIAGMTYRNNGAFITLNRLDVAATAAMFTDITPAAMEAAVRVENAFQAIDASRAGNGSVGDDFVRAAGEFQHTASPQQAAAALRSLSGKLHAEASAMTFDTIDMQRRALSSRFDQLQQTPRALGAWSRQLGVTGQGGYGRSDFSTSGWMMGSDQRFGNAIAGAAFSQTLSNNKATMESGRSRDRQVQGQLYAGTTGANGYALGQVGFGRYSRNIDRYLQLGAASSWVGSQYSGDFVTASVETGRRFDLGKMALTPYVGADYSRVANAGFSERGASGFGLKMRDFISQRTQAIAGIRGERAWRRWGVRAYAEWQQTLDSSGMDVDASFVGVDTWSSLSGLQPARSGGLAGVYVDSWLSVNSRLSFGYDHGFGPRGETNQASARFEFNF
jgi:autotransporter-associated beta strand protein